MLTHGFVDPSSSPPAPPPSRFPNGFSGTWESGPVWPMAAWQLLYSWVPETLHPPRQASQPAATNGPELFGRREKKNSLVTRVSRTFVSTVVWGGAAIGKVDGEQNLQPGRGRDRRETNERAGKPPSHVLSRTSHYPVILRSGFIAALERNERPSPSTRAHGTSRDRHPAGKRVRRQYRRRVPGGLEAIRVSVLGIHRVERVVGPVLRGVVSPCSPNGCREDLFVGGGAFGGRWDGVPGVEPVKGRAVAYGLIVAYAEICAGTEGSVGCDAVGFCGGGFTNGVGAPGVEDRAGDKG